MARKVKGNPWLSIWVRPRETIRDIVAVDPKYRLIYLCALYGFPMALNFAQSFSLGSLFPSLAILLAGLIVSAFVGYVTLSFFAWVLHVTGRWIGAVGSFQTIRAAVAWSNVPNGVTSLAWLVLFGVFGGQVFCRGFTEMSFVGYQAGVVFLVFLVQSIVSIWGFIILLKALGEVQGFSAWKALLNVIIPFVIVIGLTWLTWLIGWAIWGTK